MRLIDSSNQDLSYKFNVNLLYGVLGVLVRSDICSLRDEANARFEYFNAVKNFLN